MKRVDWVGSSRADLRGFPKTVRGKIGLALYRAQQGHKHPSAKPLRGFAGAGVLETVQDDDGDTYRAVYTVIFSDAVYVLHAFQKKSTSGIATPKRHHDLIRQRLKAAEADHERRRKQERSP